MFDNSSACDGLYSITRHNWPACDKNCQHVTKIVTNARSNDRTSAPRWLGRAEVGQQVGQQKKLCVAHGYYYLPYLPHKNNIHTSRGSTYTLHAGGFGLLVFRGQVGQFALTRRNQT